MTDLHRSDVSTGVDAEPAPDPKQAAKDEASQVASTAAEHGKQTATVAAEATTQVAGTAAEGAREVASEAAQQATEVTKQASDQARQLADRAQSEIRQQASTQTDRAASGLRDASQKVLALAEGKTDEAGPALDAVRQVAEKLDEAAGWLDQRGFDGLVDEVRGLARRRPGAFLLSAAAAGVAVGRLGKGMQAMKQPSGDGDGGGAGSLEALPPAAAPLAAIPPAAPYTAAAPPPVDAPPMTAPAPPYEAPPQPTAPPAAPYGGA